MILKSRYNYYTLHFAIFFSFVGLSIIPFLLLTVASSVYRVEGFSKEVIGIVIVVTLLMGLAFYMCIQWIGKVPKIEITEGKITFRLFMLDKTYYLRDIEDVWPDGKVPLKILITQKKEGAKLQFRNGDVWYIYDEYYRNGWQIKCWIEDVLIKKGRLREFPAIKKESLPEMNNLVKVSNQGLFNKLVDCDSGTRNFSFIYLVFKPESQLRKNSFHSSFFTNAPLSPQIFLLQLLYRGKASIH